MQLGELFYLGINCPGINKENCFLYKLDKNVKMIPIRIQHIDDDEISFSYQYDKSGYVVGTCKKDIFEKHLINIQ